MPRPKSISLGQNVHPVTGEPLGSPRIVKRDGTGAYVTKGEQFQGEESRPIPLIAQPKPIERKPIKLTYKFEGNCKTCGSQVKTLEMDVARSHFVVAYCVNCDATIEERKVAKLGVSQGAKKVGAEAKKTGKKEVRNVNKRRGKKVHIRDTKGHRVDTKETN